MHYFNSFSGVESRYKIKITIHQVTRDQPTFFFKWPSSLDGNLTKKFYIKIEKNTHVTAKLKQRKKGTSNMIEKYAL